MFAIRILIAAKLVVDCIVCVGPGDDDEVDVPRWGFVHDEVDVSNDDGSKVRGSVAGVVAGGENDAGYNVCSLACYIVCIYIKT
jgi:hypothetical protein